MSIGNIGRGFRNTLATIFQAGNRVVINSNGLFLYNGAPAAGNLIISLALVGGTDSFGNTFAQGLTVSVPGTPTANVLIQGSGIFLQDSNAADHTWEISAQTSGVPYLELANSTTNSGIFLNQNGGVVPTQPGAATPESLHSISAGFPAGWTGNVYYELLPDANKVFASWRFTVAAATVVPATGVTLLVAGTFPTAYKPINFHNGVGTNFDRNAGTGLAGGTMSWGNDNSFNYAGVGFTAGATGNNLEGSMIFDVTI